MVGRTANSLNKHAVWNRVRNADSDAEPFCWGTVAVPMQTPPACAQLLPTGVLTLHRGGAAVLSAPRLLAKRMARDRGINWLAGLGSWSLRGRCPTSAP